MTKNLLTGLFLSTVIVSASEPLTVAVFDFESKDEKDLGAKVSSLLTAELSANPDVYVLERAELDKALGEQELGLSGAISTESAAKVGHLTGAKVLVTGRIFKVEKQTIFVAKLISAETSRVFGETEKQNGNENVTEVAATLARKIGKRVSESQNLFVSKNKTSAEKLDEFLSKYKAKEKKAISVLIPERHYGSPVVDPAAETTLKNALMKAGFEIVDERSETKADIELTGEAFSAYGARKGNLISCKGRVEIQLRDRKSGKILFVDKETTVSVDIAEQTAAKTALDKAGVELAIRLLEKLNG